MNEEVLHQLYTSQFQDQMSEEQFRAMLLRGQQLASSLSDTDKLFISRFFRGDDLKAVNIAQLYNQELMIKLLSQ